MIEPYTCMRYKKNDNFHSHQSASTTITQLFLPSPFPNSQTIHNDRSRRYTFSHAACARPN